MHPVERYLAELRDLHLSGAGVAETSGYPALKGLLDEIGKRLTPKVRCIIHLANTGAGIPDGGLYTSDQFLRRGHELREGQLPAAGAIEVKPPSEPVARTVGSDQVMKYVARYGQILVTNYREFTLLIRTSHDGARLADRFVLAASEEEFRDLAGHPRRTAEQHGDRMAEFLTRVLRNRALLSDPEDVAWFFASHARDAMDAVARQELPALTTVRSAFEKALGITFEGAQGDHFFRSSLIQTLFYGIFSGWVLWSREHPPSDREAEFDWKDSSWYLQVPVIGALFEQMARPGPIQDLGLKPILDRTGDVLNRVDRAAFFQRFHAGEAVQYFYEPFLEAFDPKLRKELGVWYTPHEVVQYMVARVETILREELGVARGLADPQVYVLDPCCGTGAYLVEVLRKIAETLRAEGGDALVADDLRRAAVERVFGFEILPAPFVVAHLQLGVLLQQLGAPFSRDRKQRAGIFLTNALTGWETRPEAHLPFPELEAERDLAEDVKLARPILVILGNPPYNGFAGVTESVEERALTQAYKKTVKAPRPQGQGLNDLYVRFFRMAERKIVEQTGRGVVCFISNYSWLDGLSFTGMRERFLREFDRIWIDCLNGDKYKTGKLTPEGEPDPSIFSTEHNREGIQVGTAITLLLRRVAGHGTQAVEFRDLWGTAKLALLAEEASGSRMPMLTQSRPVNDQGLPFRPIAESSVYTRWPRMIELMPRFSPGVKTSRDLDLVSIDQEPLRERVAAYFDDGLDDRYVSGVVPSLMQRTKSFDGWKTRKVLLRQGLHSGRFAQYAYQPFDTRHVYWHVSGLLLDRPRPELFDWSRRGISILTSRQKAERSDEGSPFYCTHLLADWHLTRPGSMCFPALVPSAAALEGEGEGDLRVNLSLEASSYLSGTVGTVVEIDNPIWFHALAIGHSRGYLTENRGGLEIDWPRIPLPVKKSQLEHSVALGRVLADLLDADVPVEGVTAMSIQPELHGLGVISSADGTPLDPARGDLAITAGWGHAGKGGITMPAKGRVVERRDGALDVYLNDRAYWGNVPRSVWEYKLGGYQVIKKWLSYREKELLGRDLTPEEARYVTEMVRRIAAIIALGPSLDENYERVKADTYLWPRE